MTTLWVRRLADDNYVYFYETYEDAEEDSKAVFEVCKDYAWELGLDHIQAGELPVKVIITVEEV